MNQIDYYMYSASPFAYFGHNAIGEVAKKHGAQLNIKPVKLMDLWAVSEALPPAKRPPVRQRYRLIELQRCAEFNGLEVNPKPEFHPFDAVLVDSAIIAIQKNGGDPFGFMNSVFAGVWVQNKNLADEDEIKKRLSDSGFDADQVVQDAKGEDVINILDQNSKDAIDADAIGVPAYVYQGETFWGQDRIEYLDKMISSGRKPFVSDI